MKRRTVIKITWPQEGSGSPGVDLGKMDQPYELFLDKLRIASDLTRRGGIVEARFCPGYRYGSMPECLLNALKSRGEELLEDGTLCHSEEPQIGRRNVSFLWRFNLQRGEAFCDGAVRVAIAIHKKFGVRELSVYVPDFSLDQRHEVFFQGEWISFSKYLSARAREELLAPQT